MQENAESKRLERRAKTMLLNKEIPADKMQIVRQLMNNKSIAGIEKYSAVIDLIKSCPEKKQESKNNKSKVDLRKKELVDVKKDENIIPIDYENQGPEVSAIYVNDLFRKYKSLKIFKKRYLVHSKNYFKFSIKKRLVPSKKLFTIMQHITGSQEKILVRLPEIMKMILDDVSIDDPEIFNYLRVLQKWFMLMPLKNSDYNTAKWLDSVAFENIFKEYIITYLSIDALDTSTKEKIIQLTEEKLRLMPDLQKDDVEESDTEQLKSKKEKSYLKKEKIIYSYLMLFRSFVSSLNMNEPLAVFIQKNCNLESFSDLLKIIFESLIFRKEIQMYELIDYYNILPLSVAKDRWEYSDSYLKTIGKDIESKVKKQVEILQNKVSPYEEIVKLIGMKFEGQNVLFRAFEDQWKIVKNRKQNFENIYEENFFLFIDECVNYFGNVFLPFLDGTEIFLSNVKKQRFESKIFSEKYFSKECSLLIDIQKDLHTYLTNNPTIAITRKEMRRIKNGQIASMREINVFLRRIGSLFYQIGKELQSIYNYHQIWVYNSDDIDNESREYTPLEKRTFFEGVEEKGQPIPYYDCKIEQFAKVSKFDKLFIGKYIMSDSLHDGIFKHMLVFCFQIAYECFDDSLFDDLKTRKELRKKIKDLSGK